MRIAKEIDPRRLDDLKNKVQNADYLSAAIEEVSALLAGAVLFYEEKGKTGGRGRA